MVITTVHTTSRTTSHSPNFLVFEAMSYPLFNTYFVRDGNNNYAIVQSHEKVSSASYLVSERKSSSSIGTRTFSGRVEKPRELYQWSTSVTESAPAPAATDASASAPSEPSASSEQEGQQALNNGLSFSFNIVKGYIYFIQIEFSVEGQSGATCDRIHLNVDPNKRRLVASSKKRSLTAAAATATASSTGEASATSSASSSSSSSSSVPATPSAESATETVIVTKKSKRTPSSSKSSKNATASPITILSNSENPALAY